MLHCHNIGYKIGNFALTDFSLDLNKGDYFALLGPSGSGKSIILELIAGLRKVRSGTIFCNGIDCTYLPPQQHPIGILFQDYALFPHKNVYDNIAFPLQLHRHKNLTYTNNHFSDSVSSKPPRQINQDPQPPLRKEIIDALVKQMAAELDISEFLNRMPDTLSGGEKQRVALARTLVTHPHILLLDEPLSALDASLRNSSLELFTRLSLDGLTILHVTHDFSEASEVAQRIGILEKGNLVQIGSPSQIATHPVNEYVRKLVGSQDSHHQTIQQLDYSENIEVK